jgi:hypothetical protein
MLFEDFEDLLFFNLLASAVARMMAVIAIDNFIMFLICFCEAKKWCNRNQRFYYTWWRQQTI